LPHFGWHRDQRPSGSPSDINATKSRHTARPDGVGLPDRSQDEITLDIERFAARPAAVV